MWEAVAGQVAPKNTYLGALGQILDLKVSGLPKNFYTTLGTYLTEAPSAVSSIAKSGGELWNMFATPARQPGVSTLQYTEFARSNATREQTTVFDVNYNPWLNAPRSTPIGNPRVQAVDSYFEVLGRSKPGGGMATFSSPSVTYNENAQRTSNVPSFYSSSPYRPSQVTVTPVRQNTNTPFSLGNLFSTKPGGSYTVPPSIPNQYRR
jgi:hypothetical protein